MNKIETAVLQVTLTVRPSIVHFERGNCYNIPAGMSAELAINDHCDKFMAGLRKQYMDGHGYGLANYDLDEIKDFLRWDSMSLSRRKEIVGSLRAAVAKYGDDIPTSCGPMGFEFGDEVSSEDSICQTMEVSGLDAQRMEVSTVSYIVTGCTGCDLGLILAAADAIITHSHIDGDEIGCDDIGEVELADGRSAYISVELE